MTQMFKTFLEMAANPESSIVRKLASTIPKELGYNHDGKLYRVKELLLSESIESTTLVQAEAHRTAVEGSEPSVCLRNAMPTLKMTSKVMNVTIGEAGTYAPEIAEGTDVPVANQDYDSVEFKAKKYGGRPLITNELIEDGLFNVAELEIKKVGRSIENRLNQNGISEMMDTITTEHDTTGSDQGIKAIAKAMSTVRAAGFNPDTVVMHPEAEAVLIAEHVPSDYFLADSILKTGKVPRLFGMDVNVCGVVDNGSEVWGYAADGEIGMIVYDSTVAGAIGMRRDISVDKYDDPIKDLVGMSVLARFDVETITPTGGCRIEY